MKPTLLILIGPPGSGKTYFSRQFAERNDFTRINSDDVRESMYPQPAYTAKERLHVYQEMDSRVIATLKQGKNVIYDGNLLTNTARAQALESFERYCTVLFLELVITEDQALQRALQRGNNLDPLYKEHIHAIYQAFEPLDPGLPSLALNSTADYLQLENQVKAVI
jgi:predicted kinase